MVTQVEASRTMSKKTAKNGETSEDAVTTTSKVKSVFEDNVNLRTALRAD